LPDQQLVRGAEDDLTKGWQSPQPVPFILAAVLDFLPVLNAPG
jgi:hypothetical protein